MAVEFLTMSENLANWLDTRTGARAVNRLATPWADRATQYAPIRTPVTGTGEDGMASDG